jgi:hypothetical protein
LLFRDSKSKYVGVKIKAGKDALKGDNLNFLTTGKLSQNQFRLVLKKGTEQVVYFEVTALNKSEEATAKALQLLTINVLIRNKLSLITTTLPNNKF